MAVRQEGNRLADSVVFVGQHPIMMRISWVYAVDSGATAVLQCHVLQVQVVKFSGSAVY